MIFLRKKNELCMVNIYCDKSNFTHQNTGTNICFKTNDQLILSHVLNFLCILSWIDVINCISNFWDYCYIIIMYSSVFNQVRRRKVLYFSSYTFCALTPVVAISHTELSVLAGSAGPTILYGRLRLLLLLDRFHKNTLRQFQSLPKRAAIPSVYLLLGCFTHWSWIT